MKPNKEQVGYEGVINLLNLDRRLGLNTKADGTLLIAAFHARSLRNPLTRRAELLRHPAIPMLRTWPIMGAVIRRLEGSEERHKRAVGQTEQLLQAYIDLAYPSEQGRQHARMIVMAVNDLIAGGLAASDNAFHGDIPVAIIDGERLETWGAYWKTRIANP